MTKVFGEVADVYDEVRPGYPDALAPLIAEYAGGIDSLVEVGAGTGKATEMLMRLGVPITCVEPDERMAEILATRFPAVTAIHAHFEEWTPPPGGVPLLACALAWHWLDPSSRCELAHAALAPHGTLAVFEQHHALADPATEQALNAVMPHNPNADRSRSWIHDEIRDSGLFHDVRSHTLHLDLRYETERYIKLMATYSNFRLQDAAAQQRLREAVREAVTSVGGVVVIDMHTTLVLARREG